MKESFLISAEIRTFCSATENHRKIPMVTLTLYAAISQAGHVDQHAVSIPTIPEILVDELRCFKLNLLSGHGGQGSNQGSQ